MPSRRTEQSVFFIVDPWLLPENIADALPEEARTVERLRRALLDCYRSYGYELVMPPLLEHIESLLTGSGGDLDLATIKTVDQLSGRTVGLRADTTPQVARIDSHILNRDGVVRLCYAGPTLRARPAHPMASREPVQVGAEIYGEARLDADIEALELAVASARTLGFSDVQIDVGHTGVVRALLDGVLDAVRPGEEGVEDVLCALAAKDGIALGAACRHLGSRLAPDALRGLHALLECSGGRDTVARARRVLPDSAPLRAALDDLDRLADACPTDRVGIDLADLHGFRYHTGATFAAYVPGLNGAVLRGGRYDDIGRAFGRARPATGFSILDLREAAQSLVGGKVAPDRAIRAPWHGTDARLEEMVQALRTRGEIVVRGAGAQAGAALVVDRELVCKNGIWEIAEIDLGT
ncbi:ATP phosphoribosyltransferase regulatory subunit [Burkholderiales bacterium GJ-E10]|nr:ATP phosphoribosyltransferase regulatory subunit [Burkholderiales bacterium GJ-E10]